MTAAEFRTLQAEHEDDYRSMAGLVTAIGIALATGGLAAILYAIT